MRRLLVILFLLGLSSRPQWGASRASIINSRHDFRAASGATVRSVSEHDACVFCHTPHDANPGPYLWNQKVSTTEFPVYSSTTIQAQVTPIQPQDASKLCLSCHDGTIALGDSINDGLIAFVQGTGYTLPRSSASNLAGNGGYSNDHPFGFVPTLGTEIKNPPETGPVRLDGGGKLQCTSCHDPHREYTDPTVGKFLVTPNDASALCLACHTTAGWTNSAHRLPPDPNEDQKYTMQQGAHTGYIGVSKNGCESCHRPHAPQSGQRLVKFPEEDTCFQCHDGSVTTENIKTEILAKTYRHPVKITPSAHDASERPSSALYPLPEKASGTARHVECSDCHNPHFAAVASSQPPRVGGALLGVRGQSVSNTFLPQSTNEFEICFKCHADSANKPQALDAGTVGVGYGRNPQRQFDVGNPNRFNIRVEFQFSPSYHPVTRARGLSTGRGGGVPSLRDVPVAPGGSPLPNRKLSAAGMIFCTDCHNNDTGRNLGTFAGPAGVHASNLPHLLERASTLEPPPALPGGPSLGCSHSPIDYGLCDKCHDVERSVLRNESFRKHKLHVQGYNSACSTCHDPHASQSPALINFDKVIVGPYNGVMGYTQTSLHHGSCTLTCHGAQHNAWTY